MSNFKDKNLQQISNINRNKEKLNEHKNNYR